MSNWKNQLSRSNEIRVSLVSPLSFTLLEDIIRRANNTDGNFENFYNYQIEKSGKDTRKGFKQYCQGMCIDFENKEELKKSVDFLSRTFYRQVQDTDNIEFILGKIDLLFNGEPKMIYDSLLELIIAEDILGVKIDLAFINKILKDKKITFRNLAKDDRIYPKIVELNQEYKDIFIPLKNGLIKRNNLEQGIDIIKKGDSLIIHGKAGIGKSGYMENIIRYCESEYIPYLAIKLDKRMPMDTTERWGVSMGLPASPLHCLNAISSDNHAVLILDQLDALRWTQTHSNTSLDVCLNIIREANNLNIMRADKISIVVVTRTYDLKNDRGIKHFIECANDKYIKWHEIQVVELTDQEVKEITGDVYINFSKKMKFLLKTPNNLYIWQQLDYLKSGNDINSNQQLVQKWWGELQEKAALNSLSTDKLLKIRNKFVEFCNKNGRINAPISIIQIPKDYLDFMQSNGFMIVMNNLISFIHQSILDIFLSEYMLQLFYEDVNIEEIVGNKNQQTLGRRYQVQLFMEQLLESSEQDFIKVGNSLLISENIRWSFKYIFIELLNTLENPSNHVMENVISFIKDKYWGNHFIDNVVLGKKCYIDELQKEEILEKWYTNESKKDMVINLFASISNQIDKFNIGFIKKFIFIDKNTDQKWFKCFSWQIHKESDELFELRMDFYSHYPEFLDNYIDLREMFEECEIRAIRILILMLKFKTNKNSKKFLKHMDEFEFEVSDLSIHFHEIIVEEFVRLLPTENEALVYTDLSSKYSHNYSIERTCINILKKVNAILASTNPEKFLEKYANFKGTGNELYNEIYLDALYYLPEKYANSIICYLCTDFNKTMSESTSGSGNRLFLAKRLLSKISDKCNQETYDLLEKSILHFTPIEAKNKLRHRIEFNKEKNGIRVYWNFWGDFQYECLNTLPIHKLSNEAKSLKIILTRKMQNSSSTYEYDEMGGCKNVVSPVSGKKLSPFIWGKIITNNKINNKSKNWKETESSYIESNRDSFASSFQDAVSKEPLEFLNYILTIKDDIHEQYIDSLYSGIAYSDTLDSLDNQKVEELFENLPCDYKSKRALSMCRILEKKSNENWSENLMNKLADFAVNHEDPKLYEPNVIPREDENIKKVSSIESNAINCVRGVALCTMGHLLWNSDKLYSLFKPALDRLINDVNPIIQYACLYALWPIYNIDKEWAIYKILEIMKKDIRMCGFQDCRNMFHMLYKNYSKEICALVFNSFDKKDDERLITVGAFTMVEFYIKYNEFEEIVIGNYVLNEKQVEKLLQMLITYFNLSEYNAKAKKTLLYYLDKGINSEFPWSRLFHDKYINLDRDKDFIEKLLISKKGHRILHYFIKYLEEVDVSLLEVSDIIFAVSKELIQSTDKDDEMVWGFQNEISKLVIALYDDSCDKSGVYNECIALECLDIWDCMYEKNIGMAREMTDTMMNI